MFKKNLLIFGVFLICITSYIFFFSHDYETKIKEGDKKLYMFSKQDTYQKEESFTVTFRIRNNTFFPTEDTFTCSMKDINSRLFDLDKEILQYYKVELVKSSNTFRLNCSKEKDVIRLSPGGYIEETLQFTPKKDVSFPSEPLQLQFSAHYKKNTMTLPITIVEKGSGDTK